MEDPTDDLKPTTMSPDDHPETGLAAARPNACELLLEHPRVVSWLDSLTPPRSRDQSDCTFYLTHHLSTDALLCVLDVLFPGDPITPDLHAVEEPLASDSSSDAGFEPLAHVPYRLLDWNAVEPKIRQEIAVAIARCWLAAAAETVSPEVEARFLRRATQVTGAEVAAPRRVVAESDAAGVLAPQRESRALALLRRHPRYRTWLSEDARADTIESLRLYQRERLRSDLFLCTFTLLFPNVAFANDFLEIVVGSKRSVHRRGFDLAGWVDQWPSRSEAEAMANRVIVHSLFYGDAATESPESERGFDDLFNYLAQKMALCWRDQLHVAPLTESAEVVVYGESYEPIITAYRPDSGSVSDDV